MEGRLAHFERTKQKLLDRLVPYVAPRYVALAVCMFLYCWRIYALQAYFAVTYALGIYLLRLAVLFVSPLHVPEEDDEDEALPTTSSEEFKPFIRKMPEFKVWCGAMQAILTAGGATLFGIFDVAVFWPVLLLYFIVLVLHTAKTQIAHMVKHKYVPFSVGKKKYAATGNQQSREFDKAS
eukprot:TRINITY_DN3263_c4_g1_i1.p2 TRINITY_DN3263_c4_g1~~TRINITY_DN3263_c4_g1_i1.p2  ORF type:complete len:180 (+),score=47.36 TRINITY_DN3263_c4_g1_i1:121-660(+)